MGRILSVTTGDRNTALFRFGQSYTYENLRFIADRNAYGAFVTGGLPDEALRRGFDIYQAGEDKVHDWNAAAQLEISEYIDAVIRAAKKERTFWGALLTLFDDKNGKTMIRVFEPKDFDADYDEEGNVTKIVARERITGITKPKEHTFATSAELKDAYIINLRPSEKVGLGKSYIEPIFDELWGLHNLSENAVIFAARVGAGIRILKVPASLLADEEWKASAIAGMDAVGQNSSIMVPIEEESGIKTEFEIYTGASQIDFNALRNLLLEPCAAYVGVPRDRWIGSEMGLRSAEVNEESYFDVLEEIQQQYRDVFRWLIGRLQAKNPQWRGEFEIRYKRRKQFSEDAEVNLQSKKFDQWIKLATNHQALGITLEQAAELAGIDVKLETDAGEEIDPQLDQPATELPETLDVGDIQQEESEVTA